MQDLLGEDFAPFSPPTPVCPPITTATSSHPDTLSHLTPDNYHGMQNDSIREPVISHQGSESAASPEGQWHGEQRRKQWTLLCLSTQKRSVSQGVDGVEPERVGRTGALLLTPGLKMTGEHPLLFLMALSRVLHILHLPYRERE